MIRKSYTTLPLRRPGRRFSMENIKVFAGSCLFLIVVGNLAMLQSYRTFVDNNDDSNLAHSGDTYNNDNTNGVSRDSPEGLLLQRERRDIHRDIFAEFGSEFLPRHNILSFKSSSSDFGFDSQLIYHSGSKGRIRKLMQEDVKNVKKFKIDQKSKSYLDNNYDNSIDSNDDDINNILISNREREFLRTNGYGDRNKLLNCADVDRLENIEHLGSGWTKAVFKAEVDGHQVAVKTVDTGGRHINDCLGQGLNGTYCYQQAARKIVKEIVYLQAMAHQNVIKVLGYCVPERPFDGERDTTVAMVTELGEPIDQIKLLQMSWEDRLRVSYELTKLIEFLPRSPYGSVAINDFQRTQFVLVNGSLKLSDVDDAGFGEPQCVNHSQCVIDIGRNNKTKQLECVNGRCKDFNEYMNIMKACRHFTSFLLPHGAPRSLRPLLDRIVDKFDNLTSNAKGLLQDLDRVVHLYSSGTYLKRPKNNIKTNYKYFHESDFPGQFDYRCRFSISGGPCTLAVFDLQEATEACDIDEECKGFVWSHRKTWTGRTLVYFKNGVGKPSPNKDTNLYIKPA